MESKFPGLQLDDKGFPILDSNDAVAGAVAEALEKRRLQKITIPLKKPSAEKKRKEPSGGLEEAPASDPPRNNRSKSSAGGGRGMTTPSPKEGISSTPLKATPAPNVAPSPPRVLAATPSGPPQVAEVSEAIELSDHEEALAEVPESSRSRLLTGDALKNISPVGWAENLRVLSETVLELAKAAEDQALAWEETKELKATLQVRDDRITHLEEELRETKARLKEWSGAFFEYAAKLPSPARDEQAGT